MTNRRQGISRDESQQLAYAMLAPRVGWPGWEDQANLRGDEVRLRRVAELSTIFRDRQCIEMEAMLYLSSASLAQPFSHEWANIYFWLFDRWIPGAAQELDIQVLDLDPDQRDKLARLRRWIFETQIKHLRQRHKEA